MGFEQTTLGASISIAGIGVHNGEPVRITLFPAPAGTGIQFRRTNSETGAARTFRAHVDHVGQTELCTVLGTEEGGRVSTVEHLLAALRGLGVDNAVIAIDNDEMPIVDGSSRPFVEAIDTVGTVKLSAPRSVLVVRKPVRVENGRAWAELVPYAKGFRLEVEIDFTNPTIGRQAVVMDLTPKSFRRELSYARTFGFMQDFEKLSAIGLARGSSLDNTVVLDGERVMNEGGLRARDEFVRHKALDAVGDLALAGLPIKGLYRSYCGGHKLNVAMVRALYADPTAFAIETPVPVHAAGDFVPALQPAYSPDMN
ncbi:UDP-3-O-acyl-N-acetylglucosamine deacetylase [Terrihabitans soli]|uniref:UDP-3-O-acyl-N-acetylglucosamine deacetylase n=1 Tax=Terrihabitans soli TaxID=708113 RepID=A0A6S6QPK4_9HYPH|nr:UDP-3-O-acyl-N-acetylglucosamine deacetylase [Terrihabitans soli]BCJ91406.1 UDP-3-O-acyl-N-acetylglucosamine deacetylase [Terrihabitans soli]